VASRGAGACNPTHKARTANEELSMIVEAQLLENSHVFPMIN
jgi:hypothetical protein